MSRRTDGGPRRRLAEGGIRALLLVLASTATLVVVLIFLFLAREGLPALERLSPEQLLSRRWQPTSESAPSFGLLPLLAGSGLVTALATLIALPFGVGGAVYLASFARAREREILKPVIELVAAVPSVVLGFFGIVTVGPALKQLLGLQTSLNALTGACVLAFMAIPTILTIAEDALRAVPRAHREAALALGASPWQASWSVVVPAALPGIGAAVMLGIGRVIGETMAVMMCTGNAAIITCDPTESVRTMTATIAAEMGEVVYGGLHYRVLFLIGLLLLSITLVVNLLAQRWVRASVGGRGS
ncbi:MAG: phosphate ABC transporter permease subunit PstC [Planctomycetota bacterium]|nr:MAG: phosphate ABC transporter permease subunit PstC [Planctomycetota bacterium]